MNNQSEIAKRTDSALSPAVSGYLTKLKGKLDSSDLKMIELKYSDTPISLMADAELRTKLLKVLKRIHVITGWNLPADQEYTGLLLDELHAKLKESFDMLNLREIVAAFRENGIGVKYWGKNMNLDLVCNILGVYCEKRARVSMEEERLQNPPEQKIYTEDQILNERRGHIEIAFRAMRRGHLPIMHEYFPEVLHHDGFIEEPTEELMNELFVLALNTGRENIYEKQQP